MDKEKMMAILKAHSKKFDAKNKFALPAQWPLLSDVPQLKEQLCDSAQAGQILAWLYELEKDKFVYVFKEVRVIPDTKGGSREELRIHFRAYTGIR